MAKQTGQFVFEGTVGHATGYKMNGKYYLKTKSAISRSRIKKHPGFANTRRNAKWFGEATRLAKQVYYELDRCDRGQHTVWYPMRNRAQELVRKGVQPAEIILMLRKEFVLCRESSIVNRELKTLHEPNELQVDSLPGEILSGRVINPGVEPGLTALIDQLAASVGFIKNILLSKKNEIRSSLYIKGGRLVKRE